MPRRNSRAAAIALALLALTTLACGLLMDMLQGRDPSKLTNDATTTAEAEILNITATYIYAEGTALHETQTAEGLVALQATQTAEALVAPPDGAPLEATTITDPDLQLANPGFEAGTAGWTDLNASCGSKSDADTSEAHTGTQSRKLFLRYCGSHISQHTAGSLPAGSALSLSAWVKMPFAGETSNKWFTLTLIASGAGGETQAVTMDQYNALPAWTQLTIGPMQPNFAVTAVDVIFETTHGDGLYEEYDKPVWIDDVALIVSRP